MLSQLISVVTSGQLAIQYLGTCQTIQVNTTQRVQPGTNRPSGKRYKKRPKEAAPRKLRPATSGHQAGCTAASAYRVSGNVAVPKVSSVRATNSAILSAAVRQKIRAATALYPTAKTMSSPTP